MAERGEEREITVGRKREKEANERKERGKRREVEKQEKGTSFFSKKKK